MIKLEPMSRFEWCAVPVQIQFQIPRVTIFGIGEGVGWYNITQWFTSGYRYLFQSFVASWRGVDLAVLDTLRNNPSSRCGSSRSRSSGCSRSGSSR